MARWYVASNVTPGDNSGIDMVPNPGTYTDLDDGDICFVLDGRYMKCFKYDASSALTEDIPNVITPNGNTGNGRWIQKDMTSGARFFHGVIGQKFDALATSDGATVTMTLTNQDGGNLTAIHPSGRYTITGGSTLALTAGSDSSPTENYVYILESAPQTLAKSTSDWPTANHIKIAYFLVPSATKVQADGGCYINQNWNEGTKDNATGHLEHMAENMRLTMGGSVYHSGVDAAGATGKYVDITVNGATPDNVLWKSAAGISYQMHRHTIPAYSMAGSDDAHVVNWNGTPYYEISDINEIVADSQGNSITNKYFNLVFWFANNKSGQYSPLMINLPSGSYNSSTGAIADTGGYDNYAIPKAFNRESSTGMLICRLTFYYQAASGGTWTLVNTTDLRGSTPGTASGSSGGSVIFPDNSFRIYDETDDTKKLAFQVDTLPTATVRTLDVSKFSTYANGLQVHDSVFPGLQLYNQLGTVKFSSIYHDTTELQLKNWVNGGEVEIYGFNTGAFGRWLAKFDPDLGVSLYDASNVQQLITRNGYVDAPVGLKVGGSTVTADDILDEDNMASNSATALVTQQSVKAYVRDNAGDPALPKLDFYQDWLQRTKYQNASVLTCVVSGTLVDSTTMDHDIENKRYNFTVGETLVTTDLYDSAISPALTNITECIIDAEITDSVAGTLQVSNDGGTTWVTVTDTTQVVTFTTTGIDLVMKYTAGGTGYIEHMGVLYNPDTIYSPATEVITPGGNIIINGDFDIWQRGTSFPAIALAKYSADRFVYRKVSAATHTAALSTDVPTYSESGHRSTNSLLLDCTTADTSVAASDIVFVSQFIEGYNYKAIAGGYATLSFWVKATKTGVYCVGLRNSGNDRSYVSEYTVNASNVWQKVTMTFNLNETGGTWDYTNGIGLQINWILMSGTDKHTTPNTWQTGNLLATSNQVNACDSTDNNFRLAQVKLEQGQVATPWMARQFGDELSLCQRYYQAETSFETVATVYNASFIQSASHSWLTEMLTTPSVVLSSVTWLPGSGGGWGTIGTLYSNIRTNRMHGFIYNTTGGTLGYSGKVTYDYTAEAEL